MVGRRSQHRNPAGASDPVAALPIGAKDEPAFRTAVREGIEAADAGRLSPFEPVAEWLASWGTENELPPPG